MLILPLARYKRYFLCIFCKKCIKILEKDENNFGEDENNFGEDEIDILEKIEDENSEKMKITSLLKTMRMKIALFSTLRGGVLKGPFSHKHHEY